jgi:hypothetical protein
MKTFESTRVNASIAMVVEGSQEAIEAITRVTRVS